MPFLPASDFPVNVLPNGDVRALADVVWHGHHGDTVTVPAGYVSDWGSVPTLVLAVMPNAGPLCRAFLVHDVLCTALDDYHAARVAYEAEWARPGWPAEGTPEWAAMRIPVPPPFDAVDTDAVLRLILAELGDEAVASGGRRPFGTGPARWLYWAGVRAGALGNPARRGGFLRARSVWPFLALALPGIVALAPAAVGAAVSRVLVALGEWLAGPTEAVARRWRQQAGERVRAEHVTAILRRASAAPPCTCTPTSLDPGCARPEHRERAAAAREERQRKTGCICCASGAEPGPPPSMSGEPAAPVGDDTVCSACGALLAGPPGPVCGYTGAHKVARRLAAAAVRDPDGVRAGDRPGWIVAPDPERPAAHACPVCDEPVALVLLPGHLSLHEQRGEGAR